MVAVQARELGLNAFGEVHLTCAEGKVGLMGFESIFHLSSMSLVSPNFELLWIWLTILSLPLGLMEKIPHVPIMLLMSISIWVFNMKSISRMEISFERAVVCFRQNRSTAEQIAFSWGHYEFKIQCLWRSDIFLLCNKIGVVTCNWHSLAWLQSPHYYVCSISLQGAPHHCRPLLWCVSCLWKIIYTMIGKFGAKN